MSKITQIKTNTVLTLAKMKEEGIKISQLTSYDFSTAQLMDPYVDMIHVGDSLGMVMQGYSDTLPVTMEETIIYARSVVRACKHAFVSVDMPFMSYQISPEEALANAGRIMKETGAAAVKLEGGVNIAPAIKKITSAGIPVVGHIGMTPQSVHAFGGFKVQGGKEEDARKVLEDALAVQEAGAFAVTLECVPPKLAALISKKLDIITIGIGAGPACDGQVIVYQDLIGMSAGHLAKFVKEYANVGGLMQEAFEAFDKEVKEGVFPSLEQSYTNKDCSDDFYAKLDAEY